MPLVDTPGPVVGPLGDQAGGATQAVGEPLADGGTPETAPHLGDDPTPIHSGGLWLGRAGAWPPLTISDKKNTIVTIAR